MTEKIFVADLGSKLLKIIVAEEDVNGKIVILTKLTKNLESFRNGEIIDQENFIDEVINPLKEIAYQLNSPLKNLIVSFSSSYFIFQRAKGKIAVNEKYITEEDIKKASLIAKTSLTSSNYEILYEEPIAYYTDGTNIKIRDPLGMDARTLEVDFFVIQGLKSSISKIKNFFLKNELKINSLLPNPLPASFIILPKKEKEVGVILVDFGHKILNISVFLEGKLIYYQNFNFGVGDILEDLALDFGLEIDEVPIYLEEMKKIDEKKRKSKIKIGKQRLNYSHLVKLIEKKFSLYWKKNSLNEIFKKIKEEYRLPAGVYLIGGGSYLPEINNIFKKYTLYLTKLETDLYKNLEKEERIYLNALGSVYYFQKAISSKGFFSNFWETLKGIFK